MDTARTFRIGVSEDFYSEAREHLEAVIRERIDGRDGIECVPMPTPDKVSTPDQLDQFDAIFALATKVDAESLRGVKRLACVARWGVGYDRIDVDALTAADVALCITPNAVRGPVAEAIFTFIFALAKNLTLQDRVSRAGGWRGDLPRLGVNVAGTTLGSVGCGNIGREMFRMGRAFGFKRMLACDPYVTPEQAAGLGVEMTDMETVFRESDFVTVNTLLNAKTENLVREEHFRLMKPTAYFINTARGPIVEHKGLVKALSERWIAGAGIDVYPVEPPPPDDPLFTMDNVIVAPHAMAWTNELMKDNGYEACDNVLTLAAGKLPGSVVNRAVLQRPGFLEKVARYGRG
jgi:phosphoglycerate dehydrogenase-like enzyme